MKKLSIIFLLSLVSIVSLKAQNNPYVDDKLIHFGFSLGMDFLSYAIQETDTALQLEMHDAAYHTRVSAPSMGFAVGFITDLRLTRHLNLRFCPALHFGQRTITYKSYQKVDSLISGALCTNNKPSILSIPISIPLYIKWSAEREVNYRPYVIAGGGISYDVMRDKDKVILPKPFDCFVEVGFGCDFYFRWFKCCPEIRYRVGFLDVLTPVADREKEKWNIGESDYFYTDAISKLNNHQISLIFNFE